MKPVKTSHQAERHRRNQRAFYVRHRDEIATYMREYFQRNKERLRESNRRHSKQSVERLAPRYLRCVAKKTNSTLESTRTRLVLKRARPLIQALELARLLHENAQH